MSTFTFQSDLANMLFDTPPNPDRDHFEADLVERFRGALSTMRSQDIVRHAARIDERLLPSLSGRNLLAVAKLIELRAPAAIALMPRLSDHRRHAMKAAELAQILSPVALGRVIAALNAADSSS